MIVTVQMFDEAVAVGNKAATMANRYMTASRAMFEGITDALKQLESGLPGAARDVLLATRSKAAGDITRIEAPDLAEMIVRTIATIREQNGAAPYDGWASIHGEQAARAMREAAFEEARAVLAALGLSHSMAKGD